MDAAEQDKRCGTCRHFNNIDDHVGDCLAQVPWWVTCQGEAFDQFHDRINPRVVATLGIDCPTWAAKDEKA